MNNNEPIILGKVKRGSAGKPLLVIIILLFVGAIILFLPTIGSYFGDYNIINLVKEGKIIDFFINHDLYVDKPIKKEEKPEQKIEPLIINSKTVLTNNDITLNNFNLTTESISFKVTNTKNIDFNELNYYLVLSQSNKELFKIKLTNNNEITFNFKEKLNSVVEVKGILKEIKDSEYPGFTVSSDESGLGSLICKSNNYQIEYVLSNNNLIRIKETLNYMDNNENYFNKYEEYSNIVNNLINNGQTASIVENYTGFVYSNDIDLSTYKELKENYYSLNTKTNKIYFEMNAKGFDCK